MSPQQQKKKKKKEKGEAKCYCEKGLNLDISFSKII